MEGTLKAINAWLETSKEFRETNKDFPIAEAYHRGTIDCLRRIKEHLTSHPTEPKETSDMGWVKEPCPKCGAYFVARDNLGFVVL